MTRVRRRGGIGRVVLFDGVSLLAVLDAPLATFLLAQMLINSAGDAVLPVVQGSYKTTAEFGDSNGPWKGTHTGLDFAAAEGTEFMLSMPAL